MEDEGIEANTVHIADPVGMGRKSRQYTIFQYTVVKSRAGHSLFFPGSLSAQFLVFTHGSLSLCSSFCGFSVSLNRSQKDQWFALGKER